MKGRWFNAAPLDTRLRPGDVVVFVDGAVYTRIVISVSKNTCQVSQPKGYTPKTRRVRFNQLKEVWVKGSRT